MRTSRGCSGAKEVPSETWAELNTPVNKPVTAPVSSRVTVLEKPEDWTCKVTESATDVSLPASESSTVIVRLSPMLKWPEFEVNCDILILPALLGLRITVGGTVLYVWSK